MNRDFRGCLKHRKKQESRTRIDLKIHVHRHVENMRNSSKSFRGLTQVPRGFVFCQIRGARRNNVQIFNDPVHFTDQQSRQRWQARSDPKYSVRWFCGDRKPRTR